MICREIVLDSFDPDFRALIESRRLEEGHPQTPFRVSLTERMEPSPPLTRDSAELSENGFLEKLSRLHETVMLLDRSGRVMWMSDALRTLSCGGNTFHAGLALRGSYLIFGFRLVGSFSHFRFLLLFH